MGDIANVNSNRLKLIVFVSGNRNNIEIFLYIRQPLLAGMLIHPELGAQQTWADLQPSDSSPGETDEFPVF